MHSSKRKALLQNPELLLDMVLELEEKSRAYETRLNELEALRLENKILREENRLLKYGKFGPKADKLTDEQLGLFEGELECPCEATPEEDQKPKKPRRKPTRPFSDKLPREERVHDIPEADKVCACGAELSEIGRETAERLEVIPRQFKVIVDVRPKYACKACEGVADEDAPTVKIAPPPAQLIPKSYATTSLLTELLVGKYADAIPYYRQEKQFARDGVNLQRTTMCHWTRKIASRAGPIVEALLDACRAGPVLGIDETVLQVLKEPNRKATSKSYMWVMRGGAPENPVVYFDYDPSRSQSMARACIGTYQGVVQSDGYAAYTYLDGQTGVSHAACWAHVRRKYTDVMKALQGDRAVSGIAQEMLDQIGKLYEVERRAAEAGITGEHLIGLRNKESKPILKAIKKEIDRVIHKVPPKSKLGIALAYTRKLWPNLRVFLKHAELRLDNNLVENAIRPFVLGRKNWLFSGNPEGAKASAVIYTLIETARANGWEPRTYLRFLLKGLVSAVDPSDYRALMPNQSPISV